MPNDKLEGRINHEFPKEERSNKGRGKPVDAAYPRLPRDSSLDYLSLAFRHSSFVIRH
jgi:hypothetical protein